MVNVMVTVMEMVLMVAIMVQSSDGVKNSIGGDVHDDAK